MRERRRRGGDVNRQAYHPRSPPVNSGGQTISLIEFNPGSPQEARRLVAPLGMERVGGGGGGGKCAGIDGMGTGGGDKYKKQRANTGL